MTMTRIYRGLPTGQAPIMPCAFPTLSLTLHSDLMRQTLFSGTFPKWKTKNTLQTQGTDDGLKNCAPEIVYRPINSIKRKTKQKIPKPRGIKFEESSLAQYV